MAMKTGKQLHGKFSGLGVPKSFEKSVYENQYKAEQVQRVDDTFKELCQEVEFDVNFSIEICNSKP